VEARVRFKMIGFKTYLEIVMPKIIMAKSNKEIERLTMG
jgi:hypothetical protein